MSKVFLNKSGPPTSPPPSPIHAAGRINTWHADTCVSGQWVYAFTCGRKWEGHRLTHAYILLHTDACEYTHNGKQNTPSIYFHLLRNEGWGL